MDLRSAPEWVFVAHGSNQLAHFLRHYRPPGLAPPNLPGPEQAKTLAMPADDGGGFHDADPRSPVPPGRTEPRPQQSVRTRELRAFHGTLKDADLVAQRKNLQLER